MADRFLIAPYNEGSGLQNNLKPWLIPDTAFSTLNNAYVFRGRVRKRFGSKWFSDDPLLSRFRVNVGTIVGGVLAGNIQTITNSTVAGSIGQAFSVSQTGTTVIFTVYNPGAGNNQMLRTDNSVAAATYNLATTAFNITGLAALNGATVYFYPNLPVMGLLTFENNAFANNFLIGFDTRFAYQYATGWERLNLETNSGDATWTGNNSQFFWGTTWSGTDASSRLFFVTNFNQNEPNYMRYIDSQALTWTTFEPQITAAGGNVYLISAQILLVFKNRLIALNTWEGPNIGGALNYTNRCRYAQIGSPVETNSWRQDLSYKTNSIDAATTESIISAEFVKDRLIVYFERSTWELVYTGNQAYPFTWQKINTELGAESPFSTVPFDKVVLGISNQGVHACSGANVERIDTLIPNEVFDIDNGSDGVFRVYGIRDYFSETVYWTFPSTDSYDDNPYPRRVLVYNYRNNTWAFNDDSITAFGYYQPTDGILWSSTTVTWSDDVSWSSGSLQAQFRHVIAGNQEGYTFIIDLQEPVNAPVLQITNIVSVAGVTKFTVINHNLRPGDYIYIQNAVWSDASNSLNGIIISVTIIVDNNNFYAGPNAPFTGTYIGGGLISRVSQVEIVTKEYNFYAKEGRNAYISKVDFMVDATAAGQIQVNYYVSTSVAPLLAESALTGALLGTGNLDTFAYTLANTALGVVSPIQFEEFATRVWHPVYFQSDGEVVQFQLILNDEQMRNPAVRICDFQIHAILIFATPTTSRFQ
jgi:hypothetical protein